MQIFVKLVTGRTVVLDVNIFTKIKEVKAEIAEIQNYPYDSIRLSCYSRQYRDELSLGECGIANGTIWHCLPRRRDAAFTCVDVKNNVIEMLSSTYLQYNAPHEGLNLVGSCNNPDCNSKNFGGFYFPMGYGSIQLCPKKNKFPCVACHPRAQWYEQKDHMFTPSNFVFYNCNSSVIYCKAGDCKEGTSRVEIYATNDFQKLRTFDEKGRELAQYNFIQIETRHNYEARFACDRCGKNTVNKVKCDRGHFYHKTCKQKGCSECEVSAAGRNKSNVQEYRFRNVNRWKLYVERHLCELIEFTSINSLLLAKLLSEEALHSVDVDELKGIANKSDKNMAFYNIVKIRPDKADHFVTALKFVCQSIPASILEEYE